MQNTKIVQDFGIFRDVFIDLIQDPVLQEADANLNGVLWRSAAKFNANQRGLDGT